MKFTNRFRYYILIIFLISISCKSQKKDIVNEQDKISTNFRIDSCFTGNHQFTIVKKEEEIFLIGLDDEILTKTIFLNKLNLAIQSITDISLKCNTDNRFQVIFNENIGNSNYVTYHFFELENISKKYVWSKIYKIENNRQGTSIIGVKLKEKVKLKDYDAQEPKNLTFLPIYLFKGFQEEKEPVIDDFYDKIKLFTKTQKDLKLIGDKFVLDYLIDNIGINEKNISKYNDIAYYLEQSKLYEEAIFLLEEIIKNFPNRTVAYINLGDAYWGLENKEKAKKAYTTYITQMKVLGKEHKIPKQVFDRFKS
ncbi:MAG: tetratricopeptide repeat protein [Flavobacteriaceae bacterium]|nr:tetratricopeptide repeat protein [Flavobacteriaceae bacterium]